jgi:hypothetical protein
MLRQQITKQWFIYKCQLGVLNGNQLNKNSYMIVSLTSTTMCTNKIMPCGPITCCQMYGHIGCHNDQPCVLKCVNPWL